MDTDWKRRAEAAEKTVDVLKRKVRSLYAGDASSPFQRQLEAAKTRHEEGMRKRQLMALRSAELERHSMRLEQEVLARTAALRAILDNVTFGFMLVGRDNIVQEGFTISCRQLFGGDQRIAGSTICSLLRIADEAQRAWFELGIQQLFDDLMPEALSLDQIPRRHEIDGRVLNLEPRLVRDGAGAPLSVLFTVSDITSLEEAERGARHNAVLVGILKQKEAFKHFVGDACVQVSEAREALKSDQHVFVRRAVHTVKGNAASYFLEDLVEAIHVIESHEMITDEDLQHIEGTLDRFLREHVDVLGIHSSDADAQMYEVSDRSVAELRGIVKPHADAFPGLARWTDEIVLKRVGVLLGPAESFAQKLGERLCKPVDLVVDGAETLVDSRRVRPILQNLAHLIRNAVDHGIEPRELRGDKPTRARLELAIGETATDWFFCLSDDGGGIDREALCRKAVASGARTQREIDAMGAREQLDLIFLDGLSTKDQATDISGRGVGLAAVQAAVCAVGGSVSVVSNRGLGTSFEVRVPKTVRESLRIPGKAA
jgi:two-component system chemotaxis sensor kinase CheA